MAPWCGCASWMEAHTAECGVWALWRVTMEVWLRYRLTPDYAYPPHCRAYYLALAYELGGRAGYLAARRRKVLRSGEAILPPGSFY